MPQFLLLVPPTSGTPIIDGASAGVLICMGLHDGTHETVHLVQQGLNV
jgi:hypothetical protein